VTPVSIPYGRHSLSEEDRRAVADVLGSDWLTQGPEVGRFERAVADSCGARFAVAVNSGTSALHIACLAAGLGKGDRLWTSPNTFVASANCGLYCGGEVDFVDIDPGTCNLSVPALEAKLREADRKGALPKVLVPVHFAGQSCEMEPISRAAERYGVTVIEDACHAVGGGYKNTRVGGCAYSAMTVFSFHPVKIVTTAEGGMVLTNREDLYERLVRLRSHGITRDPSRMVGDCDGPWYYQQIDLGFNYRMTDLQAALGRSQLRRIDEFVDRRRRLAERYMGAMEGWPATYPAQHADARSAWHLFVIRLKTGEIRRTRREVFEALRAAGIQVNVHYIPVHTQPFYRRLGFREGDFPEAERYYREAISIPLYFGLSEPDQEYVIAKVREALR
jgi:UDP-4-amino-4,6-dideoxy-N-acetyl-beta-L-altrosamine transaminase